MSQSAAESLADALRAELAPSGILQGFLVDQMARGMARLKAADAREVPDDPAWLRSQAQAERTFYRALNGFGRLARAGEKAREAAPVPAAAVAPRPAHAPGDWRARVDRGPSGNLRWPVLTGTGVEVDAVMSHLEDGWTEAEVLARYPILDAADIVDCRACDAAGGAGPLLPLEG